MPNQVHIMSAWCLAMLSGSSQGVLLELRVVQEGVQCLTSLELIVPEDLQDVHKGGAPKTSLHHLPRVPRILAADVAKNMARSGNATPTSATTSPGCTSKVTSWRAHSSLQRCSRHWLQTQDQLPGPGQGSGRTLLGVRVFLGRGTAAGVLRTASRTWEYQGGKKQFNCLCRLTPHLQFQAAVTSSDMFSLAHLLASKGLQAQNYNGSFCCDTA